MKRVSLAFCIALGVPIFASAHVTVSPREPKPGVEERYTVRVPTEGLVATTSASLEVPDGVTILTVPAAEGATHEEKRDGARIIAITWTKEIKPREAGQFVFTARNPDAGAAITWKVQQHFADGKTSDWAPATKLAAAEPAAASAATGQREADTIEAWLRAYDAAFVAKDPTKLAAFYHPDVTIFEGGGINNGWADYRDHHLGPELKEMQNLQFTHSNVKGHVLGDGKSAYVTSDYAIKAKMGERDVDSGGLETLVLVKGDDGAWKIRHSHTSARPRRPAAPPK